MILTWNLSFAYSLMQFWIGVIKASRGVVTGWVGHSHHFPCRFLNKFIVILIHLSTWNKILVKWAWFWQESRILIFSKNPVLLTVCLNKAGWEELSLFVYFYLQNEAPKNRTFIFNSVFCILCSNFVYICPKLRFYFKFTSIISN